MAVPSRQRGAPIARRTGGRYQECSIAYGGPIMNRLLLALASLILVSACAVPDPETDPQVDLGNFRLLSNVAVTTNASRMGVSRKASAEEWEEVLERAIENRFAQYEGEVPYTISYSLNGYILATRGGRLALAPNSAMSITVHIWETDPLKRLEERSKQLLILEGFDGKTVIGSGLFRSRNEQMETLGAQFAKAVERWLVANGDLFGVAVTEEAREAALKDDATALAKQAQAQADAAAQPASDTPIEAAPTEDVPAEN